MCRVDWGVQTLVACEWQKFLLAQRRRGSLSDDERRRNVCRSQAKTLVKKGLLNFFVANYFSQRRPRVFI